jgi:hypothetical protein
MFKSASLGDYLLMLAMNYVPDRRSRRDGTGRGIKVTDVMGLFGPLPEWPSQQVVRDVYGRDWNRSFFFNHGQQHSRYETLRVNVEDWAWPRVVHFAYRVSSAERWRMYGSIESWRHSNRLIHFYGENQQAVADENGSVIVQTRFGEGSCEFCLASLHPFTNQLLGEQTIEGSLRFTA